MLVDLGHLDRTPDGRAYGLGLRPRSSEFAREVYDLDLRATVAAYMTRVAARKREARAARLAAAERRS
jgi:hypothetical protein